MVKVKSPEDVKAAYAASSGRAATNYAKEVAKVDNWASTAQSAEAESLYALKVQEAVAAGRRQKALQKVSNEEWKQRASTKGAQQIGTAIASSAEKQAKNVSPYLATLAGVTLPHKSADPVTNLNQRAGAIVAALVAKRKELKG